MVLMTDQTGIFDPCDVIYMYNIWPGKYLRFENDKPLSANMPSLTLQSG